MQHRSTVSAILTTLVLAGCGGVSNDTSNDTSVVANQRMLSMKAAVSSSISFSGIRASYTIRQTSSGYSVTDATPGSTGAPTLVPATTRALQFTDSSVNLGIGAKSKTLSTSDLKSLIELYVAFFNRLPDADGLSYWIDQFNAGQSFDQIAQNFYAAAILYSSSTGYSANMSSADFVKVIYKNVLGRSGTTAPPDADTQYWSMQLDSGKASTGSLIRTMLFSAHTYGGDPTWGWVANLLDNKDMAANYFAVQQGLNYNSPQDSITKTMAIAAAVTPADTAVAISLMAIPDSSFDLSSGAGVAKAMISAPADGKIQWMLPTAVASIILQDPKGLIIPAARLSCSAPVIAQLTISSDCKTITGQRLGMQQVTVSGDGYSASLMLKVIPQRKTIGTQAAAENPEYNLVVTPQGNVLAWGADGSGNLGLGVSGAKAYLPTAVKNAAGSGILSNIVAASTGDGTALALTEDGQVLSWGGTNSSKLPVNVRNPANNGNLQHIVQVSAGDSNMVALADDGTVYTWGSYNGQGADRSSQYPNQVVNPANTDVLRNIVSISAGWNYTLALSADGKVYGWGWNSSGQTGRGNTNNSPPPTTPMAVQLASDHSDLDNIVAISAGGYFSLALSANGKVYAWGDNASGQIGQNVEYGTWARAVPVVDSTGSGQLANISMIAAGGNHALAMDNAGRVYSWGYGPSSALGDGANRVARNGWSYPHKVVSAEGTGQLTGALSIAAGGSHSMAMMPDGSLLIWGTGFAGILGQGVGNTSALAVPTPVKDMNGTGLLSLAPITTYQNWLNHGR